MEIVSIVISVVALILSLATAWLTLFRQGTVKMTQPTVIFFGPDGSGGSLKIFLRTLIYSSAKRGQIVENMYIKLRHGESSQNFSVWVYGDKTEGLARGSGLFVSEEGIACNHHFLLPQDGTGFEFLEGEQALEVYISLVGKKPVLMKTIILQLSKDQTVKLRTKTFGVYFDWGPDSKQYHSHFDERPKEPIFKLY
jgi:hypothetical protein